MVTEDPSMDEPISFEEFMEVENPEGMRPRYNNLAKERNEELFAKVKANVVMRIYGALPKKAPGKAPRKAVRGTKPRKTTTERTRSNG